MIHQLLGKFHFVGIGGIGMSGIAELMHYLGYSVSGSDLNFSPNVARLQKIGISVSIGHEPYYIDGADFIVYSTAIAVDNVEIIAAKSKGIPIIHRSKILAKMMYLKNAIAVAGTHGKTTTTSLIAHILEYAGFEPTIINGGIINAYESNTKVGKGKWMIVEADESDGSFIQLPHMIGVITNIDAEHMDYYDDFISLRQAFLQFITNTSFCGFLVMCTDCSETQLLYQLTKSRRIISYGFTSYADFRADNIHFEQGKQKFNLFLQEDNQRHFPVSIPLPGEHNVYNTLAAIAVAYQIGINIEQIVFALKNFLGVKRRFQCIGKVKEIEFIDDYAHHPTEITAVLKAARKYCTGNIIVIFQPHRYSRLHRFYTDFITSLLSSNSLLVMPVYAAGETPVASINNKRFAEDITYYGHNDVSAVKANTIDLAKHVARRANPGDIVLCIGAGSITQYTQNLPIIFSKLSK